MCQYANTCPLHRERTAAFCDEFSLAARSCGKQWKLVPMTAGWRKASPKETRNCDERKGAWVVMTVERWRQQFIRLFACSFFGVDKWCLDRKMPRLARSCSELISPNFASDSIPLIWQIGDLDAKPTGSGIWGKCTTLSKLFFNFDQSLSNPFLAAWCSHLIVSTVSFKKEEILKVMERKYINFKFVAFAA